MNSCFLQNPPPSLLSASLSTTPPPSVPQAQNLGAIFNSSSFPTHILWFPPCSISEIFSVPSIQTIKILVHTFTFWCLNSCNYLLSNLLGPHLVPCSNPLYPEFSCVKIILSTTNTIRNIISKHNCGEKRIYCLDPFREDKENILWKRGTWGEI